MWKWRTAEPIWANNTQLQDKWISFNITRLLLLWWITCSNLRAWVGYFISTLKHNDFVSNSSCTPLPNADAAEEFFHILTEQKYIICYVDNLSISCTFFSSSKGNAWMNPERFCRVVYTRVLGICSKISNIFLFFFHFRLISSVLCAVHFLTLNFTNASRMVLTRQNGKKRYDIRFYLGFMPHLCVNTFDQDNFIQIWSFVFPLCFRDINELLHEWRQIVVLKIVLIKLVQWYLHVLALPLKNCKM